MGAGERASLHRFLRSSVCSIQAELQTCVWWDSNPRPYGPEVAKLFTTGRIENGRERAMQLLPEGVSELRHCCRPESNRATSACAVLYRSNRHLHHCHHTGEQAKSVSVAPTQALPRGRTGARDTTALVRPPPRYVTPKAGFEPAFSRYEVTEIFTTSVH